MRGAQAARCEVVDHRQHGDPALAHLVEDAEQVELVADVEVRRGLVEQQHRRLLRQAAREGRELPLARRERPERAARRDARSRQPQRARDRGLVLRGEAGDRAAVRVAAERDAVADGRDGRAPRPRRRRARSAAPRAARRQPASARPSSRTSPPAAGSSPASARTSVRLAGRVRPDERERLARRGARGRRPRSTGRPRARPRARAASSSARSSPALAGAQREQEVGRADEGRDARRAAAPCPGRARARARSATTTSIAPPRNEAGSRRRPSGPTSGRSAWGATSPTNGTAPATAVTGPATSAHESEDERGACRAPAGRARRPPPRRARARRAVAREHEQRDARQHEGGGEHGVLKPRPSRPPASQNSTVRTRNSSVATSRIEVPGAGDGAHGDAGQQQPRERRAAPDVGEPVDGQQRAAGRRRTRRAAGRGSARGPSRAAPRARPRARRPAPTPSSPAVGERVAEERLEHGAHHGEPAPDEAGDQHARQAHRTTGSSRPSRTAGEPPGHAELREERAEHAERRDRHAAALQGGQQQRAASASASPAKTRRDAARSLTGPDPPGSPRARGRDAGAPRATSTRRPRGPRASPASRFGISTILPSRAARVRESSGWRSSACLRPRSRGDEPDRPGSAANARSARERDDAVRCPSRDATFTAARRLDQGAERRVRARGHAGSAQ